MKRQIIVIALGSLFALPAFADGEIGYDWRSHAAPEVSKSRAQVRAELVAAQAERGTVVDGEIGSDRLASTQRVSKTREQVRNELVFAQRAGLIAVDGELGTLAHQL